MVIDGSATITPSGCRVNGRPHPHVSVSSASTHASLDTLACDARIDLTAPLPADIDPARVEVHFGYGEEVFLVYTGIVHEVVRGTSNRLVAVSHAAPVMKMRKDITFNQKGVEEVIHKLLVEACGVRRAPGRAVRSGVHRSKYVVTHRAPVFEHVRGFCEEADIWAYMSQKDELVISPHAPRPAPDRRTLRERVNSGTVEQFAHTLDPGEVLECTFSKRGADMELFSVAHAEYGSATENILSRRYRVLGEALPRKNSFREMVPLPFTPKDVARKVLNNLKKRRGARVHGRLLLLGMPWLRVCDSLSLGGHRDGVVRTVSHTLSMGRGFLTEVEVEHFQA